MLTDCVDQRDEAGHLLGLEQMERSYGARLVPTAEVDAMLRPA